jgi:hypothetical protein
MAAVAVTRSRLTTATQRRYSSLVAHRSDMESAGQTQVPPVSARMVAENDEHCFLEFQVKTIQLTEMM